MRGVTSSCNPPTTEHEHEHEQSISHTSNMTPGIDTYLVDAEYDKISAFVDEATKETLDKPLSNRVIKDAHGYRLIHFLVSKKDDFRVDYDYMGINEEDEVEPCFRIVKKEAPKILKKLIEKKADLTIKSNKGFTPIQLAVKYKFPEACEMLLEAGVSLFVRDDNNRLLFDKLHALQDDRTMGNLVDKYCFFNLRNLAARAFLEKNKQLTQDAMASHIDKLSIPTSLQRLLKGQMYFR